MVFGLEFLRQLEGRHTARQSFRNTSHLFQMTIKRNTMKCMCIKCGEPKRKPYSKCASCAFLPKDDDLVKSVYCSTGRYDNERRATSYQATLERLSLDVKNGLPIYFEPSELRRLEAQRKSVESVSLLAVFWVLAQILGPIVILLVVISFLPALFSLFFR